MLHIAHKISPAQQKIAFIHDLRKMCFGQYGIAVVVHMLCGRRKCSNRLATQLGQYAAVLGCLVIHKDFDGYRIPQREMAKIVASLFGTREYSQQYASYLESLLEAFGLLIRPEGRGCPRNKLTTNRYFTPLFKKLVTMAACLHTVDAKSDPALIGRKTNCIKPLRYVKPITCTGIALGTSKDSVVPVFNNNCSHTHARSVSNVDPGRPKAARGRRNYIMSRYHRDWLETHRGLRMNSPGRDANRLGYYVAGIYPNTRQAVAITGDILREMDDGDERAVALRDVLLRGSPRECDETLRAFCDERYGAVRASCRLDGELVDFLHTLCVVEPRTREVLKIFSSVVRALRRGDSDVEHFFNGWRDCTKPPKAGMVRELIKIID